jgi:hypothetical protein
LRECDAGFARHGTAQVTKNSPSGPHFKFWNPGPA